MIFIENNQKEIGNEVKKEMQGKTQEEIKEEMQGELQEEKKLLSPKLDVVFKMLFGEKGNEELTKGLLQSILKEEISEISLNENPILNKQAIDGKLGIMDILVKLNNKEYCDIEIQVASMDNIIERLLYYISRTYAKNIGEGENYSELKRTIGVLIADFKIKGLEELKYHTKYQLIEEKNRKIILTDKIEIHIIEIKKIHDMEVEELMEDKELLKWLYFIDNPNCEEAKKAAEEDETIKEAVKKLEEISSNKELQKLAEWREKAIRDENQRISDSLKHGREEGIKEGIKKGKEEGRKENSKDIAKKMKEKNIDINIILEVTGLTKEEIEEM